MSTRVFPTNTDQALKLLDDLIISLEARVPDTVPVTGVAVTAAAIHAALVTLGLITA